MQASLVCSVDNLPNELLSEIFLLYALPISIEWIHGLHREIHFEWVRIMLVCRHWRYVALTTPRLWTAFHICLSPAEHGGNAIPNAGLDMDERLGWFKYALPRSVNAPLDLSFDTVTLVEAALPIFQAELFRLRRLTVLHIVSDLKSCVESFFKLSMPSLHTLQILNDLEETSSSTAPIDATLYKGLLPSLRVLRLSDIKFRGSSVSLFPQLLILDLQNCTFDADANVSSLGDFIRLIESCLNLTELNLDHVIGTFPITTADTVYALPQLRRLHVKDVPLQTSRFLSRVFVSTNTTLRVSADIINFDAFNDLPALFASILPPEPAARIPLMQAITYAEVSSMEKTLYIEARPVVPDFQYRSDRAAENVSTLAIYLNPPGNFDPINTAGCLRGFARLFGGVATGLTRLRVDGDYEYDSSARYPGPWLDALVPFPRLRRLELTGVGTPLGLISALAHPPTYPDNDMDEPDEAGLLALRTALPVCPELTLLMLKDLKWTGLLETLVTVLRRRARGGAEGLGGVILIMEPSREHSLHWDQQWLMYKDEVEEYAGYLDWYPEHPGPEEEALWALWSN